jgi:hypothetical protein
MKFKLLFAFLLLAHFYFGQTFTWQWARAGSGSNSETGNSVAADNSGNAYVTGYFFSPTVTFGTYTLTNTGNYDTYVVKYDASGVIQWAKSANGAFDDIANGITLDPSGNIYITGYFTSPTLIFGTYTLTNTGGTDIFIVKYDSNGNVVWAKSEGGSNSEESNSITSDQLGNIFVTGWFQSSNLTIGTNSLTNTGGGDVFIAKYDGAGNTQWASSMDGAASDVGYGITADFIGNIYVCGSFKSSILTVGTFTSSNSNPGQADMFIAKYNTSGMPIWLNTNGGALEDIAYSVSCNFSNNVYITGSYKSSSLTFGTTTFSNASVGSCDIFVAGYDPSGNVQMATGFGGTSDDIALGIATGISGDISVTGHMHSPSMTVGTKTLVNTGTSVGDVFIIELTSGGFPMWSENEGGTLDDGGASVACAPGAMSIFVTGFFTGPSISFGSTTLNSVGNSDMFLAKISISIGIKEFSQLNEFNIFPNPNNGIFKVITKDEDIYKLEIYSAAGELVFETIEISQINISDKPKGIYFVRIISESGIQSQKIVLQ